MLHQLSHIFAIRCGALLAAADEFDITNPTGRVVMPLAPIERRLIPTLLRPMSSWHLQIHCARNVDPIRRMQVVRSAHANPDTDSHNVLPQTVVCAARFRTTLMQSIPRLVQDACNRLTITCAAINVPPTSPMYADTRFTGEC